MTPWNAYLDGRKIPLADAKVSALDRGFLFGDGVYEVTRVYDRKPFLSEAHWARLRRSLRELGIEGVDVAALERQSLELVAESAFADATLYVQVTRGPRGLRSHVFRSAVPVAAPPGAPAFPELPTTFLYVAPANAAMAAIREHGGLAITAPDLRWGRCDIKSVNLLANVLAMQSAKDAGTFEAILVNASGTMTEGSHTNAFAVVDGVVRTHPEGPRILTGVTRQFVLALARDVDLPVEERAVTGDELARATEVFVTGTTTEVSAIVRLDDRTIGDGTPGPVVRKLQAAFRSARGG
jgi:D-alanine transaminase